MQASSYGRDDSRVTLGQRRGRSDLARFSLDLSWARARARARADSESTARLESYPSPPMSGSPPLPPRISQEAAERSQGVYLAIATTQDVYRGIPTTQGDDRVQQTVTPTSARGIGFTSETQGPERMSYGYHRPEGQGPMPRPLSYPPQQLGQGIPQQQQQPYLPPVAVPGIGIGIGTGLTARPLPGPGPGPGPSAYHSAPPLQPAQESHHQATSKPQRKTKGHVASACVPCKKAHLRCDAQRPCSRCLTNGKEEVCVDVQHKKRGRPRLRDDREIKYESSRFSTVPDPMRRPISSIYGGSAGGGGGIGGPGGGLGLGSGSGPGPGPGSGVSSMSMAFDDNLRRTQSYRVLKSQPTESIAPRFPERGSASDANIYPAPLSISTRVPEPAAFLTIDLEFAKASTTFQEAIGRTAVKGQKLVDLVAPQDREKASNWQRRIQDEQKRKNPTYLPPIFGKAKEEEVMQKLGFTPEELSRYPLDWQEFLSFLSQDGQVRQIPIRMGLAMKDSIYFIVIVLGLATRSLQYPTPSPNPRDITYSYQPIQQPYSQPTPVSATFDPRQARLGDSGYGTRQMGQPGPGPGPPSQILTGLSPGLPTSYSASPSRSEYPGPGGSSPYQIPRSELHAGPGGRPPQTAGYQLPPIRNQQLDAPPSQQQEPSYQVREERSRVDIGGLLDRSDRTRSPQR